MTRKLVLLALLGVGLLALPTTATAQTMDYNTALKFYRAAERTRNEVWMGNPNIAEMVRHAIWIAHDEGVYPPNFPRPWEIGVNPNPQGEETGSRCIEYWDEDGVWHQDCQEIVTYRCRTAREVDDLKSLQNGAWWYSWTYTTAAIFAAPFSWPAALLLGGTAQIFSAWEHQLAQRIEFYENNRCANP